MSSDLDEKIISSYFILLLISSSAYLSAQARGDGGQSSGEAMKYSIPTNLSILFGTKTSGLADIHLALALNHVVSKRIQFALLHFEWYRCQKAIYTNFIPTQFRTDIESIVSKRLFSPRVAIHLRPRQLSIIPYSMTSGAVQTGVATGERTLTSVKMPEIHTVLPGQLLFVKAQAPSSILELDALRHLGVDLIVSSPLPSYLSPHCPTVALSSDREPEPEEAARIIKQLRNRVACIFDNRGAGVTLLVLALSVLCPKDSVSLLFRTFPGAQGTRVARALNAASIHQAAVTEALSRITVEPFDDPVPPPIHPQDEYLLWGGKPVIPAQEHTRQVARLLLAMGRATEAAHLLGKPLEKAHAGPDVLLK